MSPAAALAHDTVRIASIRLLDPYKMGKTAIRRDLATVIRRFDIVGVLEIKGRSGRDSFTPTQPLL